MQKKQSQPKPTLATQETRLLFCGAWNHSWMDPTDVVLTKSRSKSPIPLEIRRTQRCSRCRMERVQEITVRTWTVTKDRYNPPEGYGMTGRRPTKGAINVELWNRGNQ